MRKNAAENSYDISDGVSGYMYSTHQPGLPTVAEF